MERFPTEWLLYLTFFLTFVLEVVRFFLLRALRLNLPGRRPWSFAYYLRFLGLCAGLGSVAATVLMLGMNWTWAFALSRRPPGSLYLSGFFLIILAGVVAGLLYATLGKVKPGKDMFGLLAFLTLLDMACFVWKPARLLFGGTFFLLVTGAAGRLVRFTGWSDIANWLNPNKNKKGKPEPSQKDTIKVCLFIDVEGTLVRDGKEVVFQGEQIRGASAARRAEKLGGALLDRARLSEIIAAWESLRTRKDLLVQMPAFISDNLNKLVAIRETLSQQDLPKDRKEALFLDAVRTLLDQRLGQHLQQLLYWHYDVPQDSVRLAMTKVPHVDLKPLISGREYLGLFLSWWAQRSQRPSRRR